MNKRFVVLALPIVFVAVGLAGQEQLPRFRAGANLVRVDAYVSKDDVALTDLKAEDFTFSKTTSRSRSRTFSWSSRGRRIRSRSAAIPPTCAKWISRSPTARACSHSSSIAFTSRCQGRIARASRSSTRSIA